MQMERLGGNAKLKRQNPYPTARPCCAARREVPLELYSNAGPR